jgi:signal transduction histidine kinase
MKRGQHSFKGKVAIIVAMLLCGAASPLCYRVRAQSAQADAPRRVLVLYWDNKDYPANIRFDQSFQTALRSAPFPNIEYYPEYLESTRFPGEKQAAAFYEYLRQKYADRRIDVVVAVADPPLNFLIKHRADLFPNAPIVFLAITSRSAEELAAEPGMTGILQASTQKATLDLALTLHPETKHVFVISGTPERDKRFEVVARQELAADENKVGITYLTDLSLSELISTTASLPPQSVILYVWQKSPDERGELLETYEVLARIAPSASAPIYGMGGGNVGAGLVGGYIQGPEAGGGKLAEIAIRVLGGTRPQDIPVERAPFVPMFDWRELQRWGLKESNLPAGSVVNFKQFTFWEQYKWRIIGIVSLFVLQTAYIAVLLFERRRRKRANESLDRLNAELEQRIAARTAALDAKTRELETFAYSVAHDLKAPLRGIDGYSRLLLEDHADKLGEEGRSFVETIHTSTEEMTQLIEDLLNYSRLERREFKPDRIELGPLVKAVVVQKERETAGRHIDFTVNVNGGTVMADANGLVQALKNYLDNAVKFTRAEPEARIEVGSEETMNCYRLWVRDNGVGFDMKYHDRIFDIFQRLNHSEDYPGTGIGLAIVRKAMERMGGKAWAQSEPGHGATFYLEIPK